MTDTMVAGAIGAHPTVLARWLGQGMADSSLGLDTEPARWFLARGEATAAPVRAAGEVLLTLLSSPDPKVAQKAAAFVLERAGGLTATAGPQVVVQQQVSVASGPSVVVAALNAAFRRQQEQESQPSLTVEAV